MLTESFKYSNYTDLISIISGSRLLSLCGGPYSNDEHLVVAESLDAALKLITSALLDAVAYAPLDGAIVAAQKDGKSQIRARSGRIKRMFINNDLHSFSRRILRATSANIKSPPEKLHLTKSDTACITDHLSRLFYAYGLIKSTPVELNHKDIVYMAELGLMGYLPVDIVRNKTNKYLVY